MGRPPRAGASLSASPPRSLTAPPCPCPKDDAEEGGAAPDGYGGVEDLRDRVRAHLQRCSGLSPSRAHGIAGSVATYASI